MVVKPFFIGRKLTFFSHFFSFSQNVFYPSLTLYHTIPIFNDPEEVAFRKHCGKRRKCWKPAFSPFPRMFSTPPKTNYSFSVNFILSSAIAFKLDWSKIVSFGKELNKIQILSHIYYFICMCFEFGPVLTHSHTMTPFGAPEKQAF